MANCKYWYIFRYLLHKKKLIREQNVVSLHSKENKKLLKQLII